MYNIDRHAFPDVKVPATVELNSQLELKVDLEAYDGAPVKTLEGPLISRVDVYRRHSPNVSLHLHLVE